MRGRTGALLAAGFAFATACDSQDGVHNQPDRGDAGDTTSLEGGELHDAAMDHPTQRDHTGSDDGPMCERADSASPRDGSIAAVTDAGFVDAGVPPPDCLAPCVWELVKYCLPRSTCTTQQYWNDSVGSGELSCAAPDWWTVGASGFIIGGNRSGADIYVGGKLCFSVGHTNVARIGMSASTWSDPNHEPAAKRFTTVPDRWGPVVCGTPEALARYPNWCAQDGGCDSLVTYAVDPTAEHCAPWRTIAEQAYGNFACQDGCCPTNPPVVPVPSDR